LHDALKTSIHSFLAGENSIKQANTIEGLITSSFSEDHPAQEVAEMLAQYAPGGGPFLFNEHQVSTRLQALLDLL